MVSKRATQPETKIANTTARPASFSPRKLRNKNAIPSGSAVNASPKLWIRSASSATEFESTKIASCAAAASARIARLAATALTPARDRTIDLSRRPWECPCAPWSSA